MSLSLLRELGSFRNFVHKSPSGEPEEATMGGVFRDALLTTAKHTFRGQYWLVKDHDDTYVTFLFAQYVPFSKTIRLWICSNCEKSNRVCAVMLSSDGVRLCCGLGWLVGWVGMTTNGQQIPIVQRHGLNWVACHVAIALKFLTSGWRRASGRRSIVIPSSTYLAVKVPRAIPFVSSSLSLYG